MAGNTPRKVNIDPFTLIPLHLELYFNATCLSDATGFIIKENEKYYLITNWHVVTGRHPKDGMPLSKHGGVPNWLTVWFHEKGPIGTWIESKFNLYKNGEPVWIEHPLGKEVDVVAIPFEPDADCALHGIDLIAAERDVLLVPSSPVSIVGFPKGLIVLGKFPIYKTGHIASDIELDWQNKPVFLIDATTKGGMSGSPVVAKRVGFYLTSEGTTVGNTTKFLGVYSGREIAEDDIEVGRVWKPKVIKEILSQIK
ncbi:trypsin-like peptidase domain-containing protein [Candidatus Peregrinibacteria bacterium]|jgi:hypothetical protein|nr:trypsin-like peptidase domain-containing protein [Candidatus Peregrinibacteria bacterium]